MWPHLVVLEEEEALCQYKDQSEGRVDDEGEPVAPPDVCLQELQQAEGVQHGATQTKGCNTQEEGPMYAVQYGSGIGHRFTVN